MLFGILRCPTFQSDQMRNEQVTGMKGSQPDWSEPRLGLREAQCFGTA